MTHANPCMCGRPIQDTANLCPRCADDLSANLHKIADRWGALERALSQPGGDGGAEKAAKNSMVAVGTNLNEAAVRARRACTDAVWFTVQVIRDDMDDAGRAFSVPKGKLNRTQDDTPVLARWIAAWHLSHLTHRADRETAEEIANDIAAAEHLTFKVGQQDRVRKVQTGMRCEEHGTSTMGERVPCPGMMEAALTEHMPDLVCSADSTHRIDPATWSHPRWRKAHLDEAAAKHFVEVIRR